MSRPRDRRAARSGARLRSALDALSAGARTDLIAAVQTVLLVAAPIAAAARLLVLRLGEPPLATDRPQPDARPSTGAGQTAPAQAGAARDRPDDPSPRRPSMPPPAKLATPLLTAEHTGGALSADTWVIPGGDGPLLHRHAADATFYVLDGELSFQLGDEYLIAGPNTLVFTPAGRPHTLANHGQHDARYLALRTPATGDPHPAGCGAVDDVVGPALSSPVAARRLAAVPRGINVLVRGEHSHGRIAVMDNSVGPHFAGPPLHHHDFDELFYVLDGELTFQLGDQIVRRQPGELAFARRGTHHTWANHSGKPGRTLIVCTPAGFEPYFGQMAARQAGVEPPAWTQRPVPPTTVVGPQITPDEPSRSKE